MFYSVITAEDKELAHYLYEQDAELFLLGAESGLLRANPNALPLRIELDGSEQN